MKKYNPSIASRSTDELIAIVTLEPEDWQKDFIIQAQNELDYRNISANEIAERAELLKDGFDEYIRMENEYRANESYTIIDLSVEVLFFYHYIFRNWNLAKNGYTKKAKQWKIGLAAGIVLYTFAFHYISISADESQIETKQAIEYLIQKDSIRRANINWTGLYTYIEDDKLKTLWEIKIKKDTLHTALLSINNSEFSLSLPCAVVLTRKGIEFFPDSIPTGLFGITSRYDQLFEFEIQKKDTVTWWSKIKPFSFDDVNGIVAFKKE